MSITGLLFTFAFIGGLGMCLFRSPLYGLYTYMAVFYLHPPSRWWGESLPDVRWSLIAAIITLIALLRTTKSPDAKGWLSSGAAKILLVHVSLMWVQTTWALDSEFHSEGVTLFTKYLVLLYLIVRLADSPQRITNIMVAHICGCFYFGYIATTNDLGGRLEGVGGPGIDDANTLAMHIATGIMCAALLFLEKNNRLRVLCILALPFMLNTMILAGSRGAFLGVIAAGMVAYYLRPDAYKRAFLSYAVIGAMLFAYLAHDMFWDRMGTITASVEDTQEADSSTESRFALFDAQWEMVKDHPFGAGYRGTAVLSPRYLDIKWLTSNEGPVEIDGARSSHNSFMTTLVDQGFLGASLFIALLVWIARALRRLKKNDRQRYIPLLGVHRAAIGGALAVVFVAGIFTNYWKAEVQIWLIALLIAIQNIVDQYESPAPVAADAKTDPNAVNHGAVDLRFTPRA